MKRFARWMLLMASLLFSAWAAGEPPAHGAADACYGEGIAPIAAESCTMTLQLQDGLNAVTRPGVYHVQGSCCGQLVIDAKGGSVGLLLDGVSITSPDGPAIHIKAARQVILTLEAGTESTLTDSPAYTLPEGEDEPDGALFSKADLIINGAGSMRVTANHDDGVVSKDSLVLSGVHITVESKGDAIRGKDAVKLSNATIFAVSGQDGIKSTNDQDDGRGWIACVNSNLTVVSQADGIQAETDLFIDGGVYRITSGGGCTPENRQAITAPARKGEQQAEEEPEEELESCKGMKAANMHISSGTFVVDSRDDAMHADGSITIADGDFELKSNDDGIHADDTFVLHGGQIRVTESYEGIEAAHILLCGGKTDVTALDDGWNAASKAVSEEDSGKRRKSHDFDITVSGGEHSILAGADAIDSNGSILISGGTTMAASTNEMKEVPVDYPEVCACRITGGTLIASGSYGKNTQNFSEAQNQACLLLTWRDWQPAGETVTLRNEEGVVLSASPAASYKAMVVSAPELQVGQTLAVWQNDMPVCQRTVSEALMQYPVTPGRKPQASERPEDGAAATEPPVQTAGSMTAYPASAAPSALGYWLYAPDNATREKLPLIVYLHGGSGKGDDLGLITAADGFPQYLQAGKLGDVRAYVVCPQCPEEAKGWQDVAGQVFALIDALCAAYPVDSGRVILTGHSMGGTGTWNLAALAPKRFSCIAPMSGSVRLTKRNQEALSGLPIWAFVGENDKVVDPASSADCISRLSAVNPKARLTVFEGAAHRDVPALAWLDKELGLLEWMLAQ